MNIVYRDDAIVVAEKPRGVLSEGSDPRGMPALLGAVLGAPVLTVHRLDRETAGLMVFARDGKTAGLLSAAMQAGHFLKEYAAVVHGVPDPPAGEMCDLLFRDAKRGKSFIVDRPRHGVREARLTYRTEATAKGADGAPLSLVSVRLGTGRTHQIRVQFSGRGMPLYGDGRYGGRERAPLGLFARRLAFPHPGDGRELSFFLPLPHEEAYAYFQNE
ncbi:MAG: RluA family pseudouridine synthase [Clostridia bacterium]|nr:RluA family pseudouridine synthase [Clostridia bacterium]